MKKEEIQKELAEKIYKELIHAMNGPKGEMLGGGSEEFVNGLLTAYRIVETLDPKTEPKRRDEIIRELNK